jgi:type VI secretion system protein ImpK
VRALLTRTEAGVRGLGLTDADAADVMFALIATLDESIMLSPWPGRSEWVARPMQFEFFHRYDAGEEFFARLGRLRQERVLRVDVLHVYFFCLALGFRGWYQVRPRAEWQALVEAVAAQLRRGDPAGRPPLAPHGMAREEIAEAVREIPVWVVVVAAVAAAFALYLALTALVAVRVGAVEALLTRG